MLTAIPDAFLSLIYPQDCRNCKHSVESSADGAACRACWENTRIFSEKTILCNKCGIFLMESECPIETLCRRCDDHFYDSARAIGVYENALAASVVHLKQTPHVAKLLRILLKTAFQDSSFQASTLIVPVPLSPRRLLERGFNQAGVLGRIVAKDTGIDLDEHSLIRTLHSPMHRAAMDKKAREMTVKNAFQVSRPKLIANQNILLVDDVFTSGSTASHCAKTLKKSGAGKVNVLTLARAV